MSRLPRAAGLLGASLGLLGGAAEPPLRGAGATASGVAHEQLAMWRRWVDSKYPALEVDEALRPGVERRLAELVADECRVVRPVEGAEYHELLAFGAPGEPGGLATHLLREGWGKYAFGSRPAESAASGDFVQVMATATKQIFCLAADCGAGQIVVCHSTPVLDCAGELPMSFGEYKAFSRQAAADCDYEYYPEEWADSEELPNVSTRPFTSALRGAGASAAARPLELPQSSIALATQLFNAEPAAFYYTFAGHFKSNPFASRQRLGVAAPRGPGHPADATHPRLSAWTPFDTDADQANARSQVASVAQSTAALDSSDASDHSRRSAPSDRSPASSKESSTANSPSEKATKNAKSPSEKPAKKPKSPSEKKPKTPSEKAAKEAKKAQSPSEKAATKKAKKLAKNALKVLKAAAAKQAAAEDHAASRGPHVSRDPGNTTPFLQGGAHAFSLHPRDPRRCSPGMQSSVGGSVLAAAG